MLYGGKEQHVLVPHGVRGLKKFCGGRDEMQLSAKISKMYHIFGSIALHSLHSSPEPTTAHHV